MKKLICLLLVISSALSVFAQKDAIEYNDMIVDEQNKIGQKIIDFNYAVESGGDMEMPLKLTLAQIDASIATLQKMSTWEDGAALKASAIELFKFYKSIVSVEYREMVNILYHENLSEADINRLDELMANVSEKEKKYDADFQKAQEAYAKRWNIDLIPNDIQDEIDGLTE